MPASSTSKRVEKFVLSSFHAFGCVSLSFGTGSHASRRACRFGEVGLDRSIHLTASSRISEIKVGKRRKKGGPYDVVFVSTKEEETRVFR